MEENADLLSFSDELGLIDRDIDPSRKFRDQRNSPEFVAGISYTVYTNQHKVSNLPLFTSLPVAGGTGQQLEECIVGWNCSRGLGRARGRGGASHPTQTQPLHSCGEAGCGNAETRREEFFTGRPAREMPGGER